MAMDFSAGPGGRQHAARVESALQATHNQLVTLLPRYGLQLTPAQVWQRIGVTVMIGQNDIQGERFTVADAQGRAQLRQPRAPRPGLPLVAQPRHPVRLAFPENGLLSNTCSGTAQSSLQFSHIFSAVHGQATRRAEPHRQRSARPSPT